MDTRGASGSHQALPELPLDADMGGGVAGRYDLPGMDVEDKFE
jgi:hypothetical protein